MTKKAAPPIDVINETEGVTAAGIFQTDDGYKAFLAPLGKVTDGDDRILLGELGWREGRLPLMFSDSEMGHGDAFLVGNLDNLRVESREGADWAVADVDFDSDDEGSEAQRLVDEDRLRGVSVHLTDGDGFVLCSDDVSEGMSREDAEKAAEGFDWETCEVPVLAVVDPVIGGATIVAMPAFADAEIIVASADLYSPPSEWFTDPSLDSPTALQVSDDGRVFGHLALWDSCHRGFNGVCVTPPRDSTDYEEFHSNAKVSTDDGIREVGCLTVDVSHADTKAPLDDAKRHYDHSGTVAAYVRAGQDEHGVWVAGAVAPELEKAKVEVLRRLSLSGDWRPKDGTYHLIAAQAVPVPGFAIRARVADGAQTELVTVGPAKSELGDESEDALVASALLRLSERIEALDVELRPVVEAEQRRRFVDIVDSMS